MKQDKLNHMRNLAQRVVERSTVEPTQFSEPQRFYDDSPRAIVTAFTEGSLGGIRFATWLPVASEVMAHDDVKESITTQAQRYWRLHALSHILRPSMLIGPKGRLPE